MEELRAKKKRPGEQIPEEERQAKSVRTSKNPLEFYLPGKKIKIKKVCKDPLCLAKITVSDKTSINTFNF